jgi:hypothetical protein
MARIKFVFGKDVQLYIPGWPGAMVERLRKLGTKKATQLARIFECTQLYSGALGMVEAHTYSGAEMTFGAESHEFRLWFNPKRQAWELVFSKPPTKAPRPPRGGKKKAAEAKRRGAKKSAPRAAPHNARKPWRKRMKRLVIESYKTVRTLFRLSGEARSRVVKLLTKSLRSEEFLPHIRGRTVDAVQHIAAQFGAFRTNCAQRFERNRRLTHFAEFASLGADGMRLERKLCGAEIGFPLMLSTLVPASPQFDWSAAFGELEFSERFVT